MARDDRITKCPLCQQPAPEDIVFHADLAAKLPGRVGVTDIDNVLEKHSSGSVLVLEHKHWGDYRIDRGQALLFDTLKSMGCDVYIIFWPRGKPKVNPQLQFKVQEWQHPSNTLILNFEGLQTWIRGWWDAH